MERQREYPNLKRGGSPGRAKGNPNKATAQVREVIARFAEDNAERFGEWITQTAEKDPARAAELFLRALEYHLPKMSRTELAAGEGADVCHVIKVNIGRDAV
jgi:hypothetical protein